MRFVQFYVNGNEGLNFGVRVGEEVLSLSSVTQGDFIPPKTLLEYLRAEDDSLLEKVKTLVASGSLQRFPLSQVRLTSPILSPDKVVCVGMNYKDHCEEQNVPVPVEPILFNKFPSSLAGPFDDIPYPQVTKELDFEVELAFIVGKTGKNIPEKDALSYIFGYSTAHDVSARDWQLKKNGGQWLLGKTMDKFSPLGPEIVTTDELPDPHNLTIRCRVNDETVQDSSTSQMVHRVEAIFSFMSRICTLLPGDVVLTGTPPGVGVFRNPPRFLEVGDVVECSIENIGTIRNKIVKDE